MNEATTTNLADFGYRELAMVRDLLTAMIDSGLPDDFEDSGVQPMMNRNSGNVFLTNEEYQVAMLTDEGKLESFYWLSYAGNEGFAEDLFIDFENGNISDNDYEELVNILESNGMDDKAEIIRNKMEEDDNE